ALAVQQYEAPVGEVETALAGIWQELLGLAQVGRHDHFFELGGHSLLAVQVASRLRQQLGIDAPLRQLFANPTLVGFAGNINQSSNLPLHPNLAVIRRTGSEAPLFLVHPGEGEIGYVRDLSPWINQDIPILGFAASGLLRGEVPLRSVSEMAACYVTGLQYVQPKGPYRIAGWSAGGTIAYEMANQLMETGEMVEFLGLIDTTCGYRGPPDDHKMTARAQEPDPIFDDIAALHSLLPADATDRGRDELKQLSHKRDFEAMVACLNNHKFLYSDIDSETIRRHLAVRHGIEVALDNYIPAKLEVPVSLFSALDEQRQDTSLGWGSLLSSEYLTVLPIDGNHYTIMDSSHIQALGDAISQAIARSKR
ncbi:thioesterase domain-containing protein, partial [Janthinobacterium sp. GB4P2]|uniref:thioesterase domain-containing protein n=1 Tax=Janthinobacterium sp. GB4P2 TaxID=3424189 RepID=UPI003F298406